MNPDEERKSNNSRRSRGRNLALFYYQQEGSKFYPRVTPLGLLIVTLLTLIAIVALIFIFFINQAQQSRDLKNINVNITPTSHINSNYPTIQPVPSARPLPKTRGRSNINSNNAVVIPQSGRNANDR